MAIDKKLITFAKKEKFLGANGINNTTTPTNGYYGQIPAHSIVFIKDTGEIWEDGVYFGSVDTQISKAVSSSDDGIVFKSNGKYYRGPLSLWGNTVDGNPLTVNDSLIVKNNWVYGLELVGGATYGRIGYRATNETITNAITFTSDGKVNIPNGQLTVSGGNILLSSAGTQTVEISNTTGDIKSLTGYLKGKYVYNTQTYIDATFTQGCSWTDIKQFDNAGSAINFLASNRTIPAYLNIQAGSRAGKDWHPWIVDGDATSKASWGIGLSGDNLYIGRVAYTQSTNALSNSWVFDSSGYLTAKGYKVPNGTSAGFLKADGSVDTNSYINDGWIVNYSPTNVTFSNGAWVNSGINFSNYTAMTTGSYLLLLDDGGTYYTGVFSYYNGNINTDEEILLHAAGNRTIYVDKDIHGRENKPGVLYAKLKSSGSAPALYLAHSHSVTLKTITIKIKKLAAI